MLANKLRYTSIASIIDLMHEASPMRDPPTAAEVNRLTNMGEDPFTIYQSIAVRFECKPYIFYPSFHFVYTKTKDVLE